MKFNELQYELPVITPEESAARAIKIIDEAKQTDSGFLVYLLQPSNLLALAGLRAESPYNEFSDRMTGQRIKQFKDLLEHNGFIMFDEAMPYDTERLNSWSLLRPAGFAEIPQRYGAVRKTWFTPINYSDVEIARWCFCMERILARMMDKGELPSKWLLDWWAPHNLRFGMLLGYPGKAISSMSWSNAAHRESGDEPAIKTIMIAPVDVYYGAEVSFYVRSELGSDRQVQKLAELWMAVLALINDRFPHETMLMDEEFHSELDALDDHDRLAEACGCRKTRSGGD